MEEVVEDIEDLRSRGDELRTWWLDRKASPEYAAMRDQASARYQQITRASPSCNSRAMRRETATGIVLWFVARRARGRRRNYLITCWMRLCVLGVNGRRGSELS